MESIKSRIQSLTERITGKPANVDELIQEVNMLKTQLYKELKPKVVISDDDIKGYYESLFQNELALMESRCKEWFGAYMLQKPHIIGHTIESWRTSGDEQLIVDLDFLFSRLLWLLSTVDAVNCASYEIMTFVGDFYDKYLTNGHRGTVAFFVRNYCAAENRPYTTEEMQDINNKVAAVTMEIMNDVMNDELGE